MQRFNFEASKKYWRHAPSGEGKLDTVALLNLSDEDLEAKWDEAFTSRFRRYPEEECFAVTMGSEFSGERILSIGSGLGFHEIYYARQGAHVTCYDIVPSNLQTIVRVASIKGIRNIDTLSVDGVAWDEAERLYNVIFVYGSLMTMPRDMQRELINRGRKVMTEDGRIILMLYTWQFAEATCGWTSKAEFDPHVFARASDPSVLDEHCPWSDWHDDEKLISIAGNDATVTRRQFWQQGWFAWYELMIGTNSGNAPKTFFDDARLSDGERALELDISEFSCAEGIAGTDPCGAVVVETYDSQFSYALVSPEYDVETVSARANALLVDIEVLEGGVSAGILDLQRQEFVGTCVVIKEGRQTLPISFPKLPARYQVIISNHLPNGPGRSKFALHCVALMKRREPSVNV